MKWWVSNRAILSDLQRDVTQLTWSQAEIIHRLKELKAMHAIVARPGDRGAALAELWQIRDLLAESDPDLAAKLHGIYNALVTSQPEGTDAS